MTAETEAVAQPVMHQPLPSDDVETPAAPPADPFVQAGFCVEEASWRNRPVRWTRFPFAYPDPTNRRLQAFRDRYGFESAIAGEGTEFEKLLRLRDWVHNAIPSGNPVVNTSDPFEILDSAAAGGTFFCTHYAIVMQACLASLGWVSRKLGIDSDHGPDEDSTHHGVVDVFVNELDKWVALDAHHEVHYEKDGVPLSPWEISCEYAKTEGASVDVCVGVDRRKVEKSTQISLPYRHESCSYFWCQQYWGMTDPFSMCGEWETLPRLKLVLVGPQHEGKVWYQGRANVAHPHVCYSDGSFQFTRRFADAYPDVGTCHLGIGDGAPGSVRVTTSTFTPNLETLEASVDGKAFRPVDPSFDWFPHPGENTLAVRTKNGFGVTGPVSQVSVTLEDRNATESHPPAREARRRAGG